jgi:hypothetical protein
MGKTRVHMCLLVASTTQRSVGVVKALVINLYGVGREEGDTETQRHTETDSDRDSDRDRQRTG